MEYHWLNWPKVEDGKHRYCIPEKGIIFIDEYIDNQYSEHDGFFEVNASVLSPEEKTAMLSRVTPWKKHGGKWRYRDKVLDTEDYKQVVYPEISEISHQEMLDNVSFVVWGKGSRKTFFGVMSNTDEILRNHFNLAEQVSIYTGKKYDAKINEPKPSKEVKLPPDMGYIGNMLDGSPVGVLFNSQILRHVCVIGGTGSGKTCVAFVISEEALMHHIPVLALDPSGMFTRVYA